MSIEELESFRRIFRDVPACRIATVSRDGAPHVATRWFVWSEHGLFVCSRLGDTTWTNAEHDPRVSVVIDHGRDWIELGGMRVDGTAELQPAEHPDMRRPMSGWHEKYRSFVAGEGFEQLTRDVPVLGFARITPTSIHAWDHRHPGIVRSDDPA